MYRMFRSEWVYLNMSAGRAFWTVTIILKMSLNQNDNNGMRFWREALTYLVSQGNYFCPRLANYIFGIIVIKFTM
jgi:hypothetical protein